MAKKQKAKLVLTTSSLGNDQLPTLDDLIKFYQKLTGRTPSAEDVEAARKIYQSTLQKASKLKSGSLEDQ